MSQKRVAAALAVSAVVGIIVGRTVLSWRNNQPVYVFGEGAAKADPAGPAYAEKRAAALIQLVKETEGDPGKIGLDNLRLPDQNSAEDPHARRTNVSAWTIPRDACFANIAVYTDLYSKRNRKYYKGDTLNAAPSGFLIVGMKNGVVKRVPVSETRLMPYQDRQIMVFPGVIGYQSTLAPCPSYQTLKQH